MLLAMDGKKASIKDQVAESHERDHRTNKRKHLRISPRKFIHTMPEKRWVASSWRQHSSWCWSYVKRELTVHYCWK